MLKIISVLSNINDRDGSLKTAIVNVAKRSLVSQAKTHEKVMKICIEEQQPVEIAAILKEIMAEIRYS